MFDKGQRGFQYVYLPSMAHYHRHGVSLIKELCQNVLTYVAMEGSKTQGI